MKLLRNISLIGVMLFSLFTPVAVTTLAYADAQTDINNNLCAGANIEPGNASCAGTTDTANQKIKDIVSAILNILSFVVGVAAVIMIIIGGIRYTTSGGDSGSVSGAKNTIIYAIVGLIVVALAQVIVRFVVGKATTTAG